jgi:hypothetical protein
MTQHVPRLIADSDDVAWPERIAVHTRIKCRRRSRRICAKNTRRRLESAKNLLRAAVPDCEESAYWSGRLRCLLSATCSSAGPWVRSKTVGCVLA